MYPKILSTKIRRTSHAASYNDAQALLERIITEKRFRARSAVGLWPANSVGDDIELYGDDGPTIGKLHTLRQQKKKDRSDTYYAMSDFVAPKDSGQVDACGAFVACIDGVDTFAKEFEDAHDDYSSIMVKAIGDRFAEASLNTHTTRCAKSSGATQPTRHSATKT